MSIKSVKEQGLTYRLEMLDGTVYTSVPKVGGNTEYELIKQWLAEGNIPEPEFTEEELLAKTKHEIESAIQAMLDAKAKEMRYDNMMSARSYAGFENPFQVEAQALAVWCAGCWKKAGELEVGGNVYTVDEVLAQMPEYVGV